MNLMETRERSAGPYPQYPSRSAEACATAKGSRRAPRMRAPRLQKGKHKMDARGRLTTTPPYPIGSVCRPLGLNTKHPGSSPGCPILVSFLFTIKVCYINM
jgi:hypothetical protein